MTWPPPEALTEFYQQNYRYDALFQSKAELYRGFARSLLGNLDGLGFQEKAALLDIGCGGGFLVEEAERLGFSARGLEANALAVDFCRRRGLNVIRGDLTSLTSADAIKFDIVVLSAVIEHVEDPLQLLMRAKGLLADDGVILISQADFSGLLPRIAPWLWYGWQPAEHYWHFDRSAFQKLAERAGLYPRRIHVGSLYHPWSRSIRPKDLIGRNSAALVARIGNYLGQGDSFDMVLSTRS